MTENIRGSPSHSLSPLKLFKGRNNPNPFSQCLAPEVGHTGHQSEPRRTEGQPAASQSRQSPEEQPESRLWNCLVIPSCKEVAPTAQRPGEGNEDALGISDGGQRAQRTSRQEEGCAQWMWRESFPGPHADQPGAGAESVSSPHPSCQRSWVCSEHRGGKFQVMKASPGRAKFSWC